MIKPVKVPIKFYQPNLRQFNNFLSGVVILLAFYILAWPWLPQLAWWVKHDAPVVSSPAVNTVKAEPIPADNMLVIPKISLRQPIIEGSSLAAADKGVWRRPGSVQPPAVGNSVIVGHRFTYQGRSFFYHLDKLEVGDSILIYWEGAAYNYIVVDTKVVLATDVSVEAPTDQRLLTLYTCTPLWSAKDRLVIQALPVEEVGL